jgi:Papain-like cysteine protease AvrRpt2
VPEAMVTTLPVPFRPQKFKYSCAAASLEMAAARYKPDENPESWQEDMVEELSEPVPDGTDNTGIPGNKLIAKARQLGFRADGGRVSPDLNQMIEQVTRCITKYGMPLIAYQRLTNEEPFIGHCRVIFGVCENGVILHDPHPDKGGSNLNWNWGKLQDFWLRTGENVTGGVAVWVGDRDGPEPDDVLLPIEPNTWLSHTWPPGTLLPPD